LRFPPRTLRSRTWARCRSRDRTCHSSGWTRGATSRSAPVL